MANQRINVVNTLSPKEIKDLRVLAQFTSVYCKSHHYGEKKPYTININAVKSLPLQKFPVCNDCRKFLNYAFARRLHCPLEKKPACKHCEVHCYKPDFRQRVREIMKFSGQYLIKRGRIDLLWHYWF